MTFWIATFGGVGLLKPAPGTWGSAAAVVVGILLHMLVGPVGLIFGIVAATTLGWWATALETKGKKDHDPSEIVIDEVAGQWIALLPVSIGAAHVGMPIFALWPGLVTAFIAFRLFDIWKPGPVGWADRKHGPLGVMLDDLIAGVMAAVVVVALAVLAHEVFIR